MRKAVHIKIKPQNLRTITREKTRVLGIDPGYGRMGYGVIEEYGGALRVLDYGCFETEKAEAHAPRLLAVKQRLEKLITNWKPDLIATESLFFSKNVKTALAVGEARGVVLLTAAEHNLSLLELSPQEVKQAVTGYGNAEKQQVQKMVQMILHLPQPPKPDDAADALALAIAAAHMRKFLKNL